MTTFDREPNRNKTITNLLVALAVSACISSAAFGQEYDLVINNGRVIDPEIHLDARRNVGVNNGRIEVVTEEKATGKQIIAASGLVVAPGFINPHVHGFDPY